MEILDPEQIAAMNGQNQKPCYIVYEGRVYDVSKSKMWPKGLHMRIHRAGSDLTAFLRAAPHGAEVLERYPQIWIVRAVEPEPKALDHHPLIARLLDNSFLKRHPHPMVVHFPIALMICAVLFYAAYLVCGSASLESTAFHCLAAGTFFSMPAIATGYLTWKLNYGGKPIRPVRIKILLSWILLPAALLLCVWRAADPAISQTETAMAAIYGLLLFLSALLVSIIGWYGGRLIFPSESGSAGAW